MNAQIHFIDEMRDKYQLENAPFTRICNAIFEDLARTDLSGAQRRILDVVIRQTYGFNKVSDWIPISQFCNKTGMNEHTVRHALNQLYARNILIKTGGQRGQIKYNKYAEKWTEKRVAKKLATRGELVVLTPTELVVLTPLKRKERNIALPKGSTGDFSTDKPPKKSPSPKIPYQQIVDLYNAILSPPLPKCLKLTDTRKGYIKQRWMQDDLPDIDNWKCFFESIKNMPFLLGKIEGNGNRKPFIADIEWLIRPTNYCKILEGKYER